MKILWLLHSCPHICPHMWRVILNSISRTVAPGDYTAFPSPDHLPDAFTPASRRQCFNVVITDDAVAEPEEQFTVNLTLVANSNFSRITVDPDLATIIILDDDSECNGLSVPCLSDVY